MGGGQSFTIGLTHLEQFAWVGGMSASVFAWHHVTALSKSIAGNGADEPVVEKFGWQFRPRDKVIQSENDYDKDVFNGDIGQIVRIDPVEREVTIRFDQREVAYDFSELDEVSLAYAITKGSEMTNGIFSSFSQAARTASAAVRQCPISNRFAIHNPTSLFGPS